MQSEQEAIHAIPLDLDIGHVADILSDSTQVLQLLDKNHDGNVTEGDLEVILEELGMKGAAANTLSKYIFKQLDTNNKGSIEAREVANAGNILWNLSEKRHKGAGH